MEADGISRFSRLECLRHARVYDSAAFAPCSPITHDLMLPSPYLNRIGTRNDTDFGAQWLACTNLHFERSRQKCCHLRPSEEGRSRWLIVLRKTLSFSIPSRFSPALSGLVFSFCRVFKGRVRGSNALRCVSLNCLGSQPIRPKRDDIGRRSRKMRGRKPR